MGIKSSFEKRPNNFKTIPKGDIKGKMLRFKFNRKVCRERLPKFKLGSLGKRWERSNTLGTLGTLATFQTCQTFPDVPDVPLHIYISLFRK